MSYKAGWEPGVWSAICDVCGFRFKSTEIKDRWDGLKVCLKDWEPRHPQDFVKARRERITPPWTRPEVEPDQFIEVCYLWERSAYAGLASAGCAQAGNDNLPYIFLRDLKAG